MAWRNVDIRNIRKLMYLIDMNQSRVAQRHINKWEREMLETMAVIVKEHQPCDCGKIVFRTEHHCWEHHVDERVDHHAFTQCGECFHIYPTKQDLLDAHNAVLKEMNQPPRTELGDLEYFCAYCIHDF